MQNPLEIDRAAEALEMLELLYNSIRHSDNVKNCILEDVRPNSAKFVIREAIGVIERMKEGAKDEDRT